mmetsp:Transcript_11303/g.31616  ORF Transcript_11303/g.31616 Transcript_11303/m.31616 type:complete len:140 (-) Transcript_11303:1761-2180(-)
MDSGRSTERRFLRSPKIARCSSILDGSAGERGHCHVATLSRCQSWWRPSPPTATQMASQALVREHAVAPPDQQVASETRKIPGRVPDQLPGVDRVAAEQRNDPPNLVDVQPSVLRERNQQLLAQLFVQEHELCAVRDRG